MLVSAIYQLESAMLQINLLGPHHFKKKKNLFLNENTTFLSQDFTGLLCLTNSVLCSRKRMEFRVTVTSLSLTIYYYKVSRASQLVLVVKNPPAYAGDTQTQVRFLSQEDPLEKEMAMHSNSCLENPIDRRVWQATVHRVTKNWTWLKRLSMHTKAR